MKKFIDFLFFIPSLLWLFTCIAFATPQTSDADLKAAQTPPAVSDGVQIWGNNVPTFSGNYTDLTFVGAGGVTQSGSYNIADSTVSIVTFSSFGYGSPTESGTVSPTLVGHITTLSLNDFEDAAGNSYFLPTINGQVDAVSITMDNNTTMGLTSNQTAALSISSWTQSAPVSSTIEIDAPNVTSFSFPDNTQGYNSLTFTLGCDQASTDSILVGLNDGGTSGANITINGTSSTPSSTGLTAETNLVSNGCTVTTN